MKTWFLIFYFFCMNVMAAQKATINVTSADVYADESFDSDIIDSVNYGETYLISNKIYGAFYKIKLKSGKIGYIPDHEVTVNGKIFEEKPYREDVESVKPSLKKNSSKATMPEDEDDPDEDMSFMTNYRGVTAQLINYHEETMGTLQVDNLYAFGYKSIAMASIWEVFGSFQAPRYYAEKTGGSAEGFNIWGSSGFNTIIPVNSFSGFRYGGSLVAHLSRIKVSTPLKNYDLQDVTLGIILEGGYVVQFKKVAFDLSAKYFFDRNNYGALGVSLLF